MTDIMREWNEALCAPKCEHGHLAPVCDLCKKDAEIAALHAKDSIRTREHNLLVAENRSQADQIAALRADAIRTQNEVVMPLRERIKGLEDALRKACDDMEGWGLYAPEYFREKHDFVGDVEAARAALGDKT